MSVQTLLIIILISAFFITIGALLIEEPGNYSRKSFNETLAWGIAFFITMGIQMWVFFTMS